MALFSFLESFVSSGNVMLLVGVVFLVSMYKDIAYIKKDIAKLESGQKELKDILLKKA